MPVESYRRTANKGDRMYANLLDDSSVHISALPDIDESADHRAALAEIDAAYAEYLANEQLRRQWPALAARCDAAGVPLELEAADADATPEQDSGEDDGRDWEYIERVQEYGRGLGDCFCGQGL